MNSSSHGALEARAVEVLCATGRERINAHFRGRRDTCVATLRIGLLVLESLRVPGEAVPVVFHLILATPRWLADPSLDQASRPEEGLAVEPWWMPRPEGFPSTKHELELERGPSGARLDYRIITCAVTNCALHCGIPGVERWAQQWLSGEDRTVRETWETAAGTRGGAGNGGGGDRDVVVAGVGVGVPPYAVRAAGEQPGGGGGVQRRVG